MTFRRTGWTLGIALAVALFGCSPDDGGSSSPTGTAGSGSSAGNGGAAAGAPAVTWLKGDLHNHTADYSDDARRQRGDDLATSIELAERVGLDYWALTDHRTTDGTRDPAFRSSQLILIPGEEWGSTSHAGTLGVTSDPPTVDGSRPPSTWNDQVQQAVDHVHASGGVFIANHPTRKGSDWIWNVDDLDAIEVVNSFWGFLWMEWTAADLDASVGPALRGAGHRPYPALRQAAGQTGRGQMAQALAFYEGMLARGHRLALTGGGDRHMLVLPGHPTTWVGATTPNLRGVLEAIREGRTSVSAHPDGARVTLEADGNRDGVFETLLGGKVPAGRPVAFRIRVENAAGGSVELVRSGQVVHVERVPAGAVHETTFVATPSAGDFFRVNYWEDVDTSIPGGPRLLQAVLTPNLRSPNFSALPTWWGISNLVLAVPSLDLDRSWGTVLPSLDLTRAQTRILNADIGNPTRSMGGLTSAIHAR